MPSDLPCVAQAARTLTQPTPSYRPYAPRVDFDEVEFHGVRARRQIERLLNVRSSALDVVTATKLHFAARGNFAAGPSLKIFKVFKAVV